MSCSLHRRNARLCGRENAHRVRTASSETAARAPHARLCAHLPALQQRSPARRRRESRSMHIQLLLLATNGSAIGVEGPCFAAGRRARGLLPFRPLPPRPLWCRHLSLYAVSTAFLTAQLPVDTLTKHITSLSSPHTQVAFDPTARTMARQLALALVLLLAGELFWGFISSLLSFLIGPTVLLGRHPPTHLLAAAAHRRSLPPKQKNKKVATATASARQLREATHAKPERGAGHGAGSNGGGE